MPGEISLVESAQALKPIRPGWPVFRQDYADHSMFYAPGCLCLVAPSDAEHFETTIIPPDPTRKSDSTDDWGVRLWQRAERAIAETRRRQTTPFAPECLTLYLNNECNLDCVYCYTNPAHKPALRLELASVAAAAEVVIANCRQKGLPFRAVFHGGGEPTLHQKHIEEALILLDEMAIANNIERFYYIATNGVVSERKAQWLCRNFNLIGLSCDGMAEIQDRQRPRYGGGGTSQALERTADILHRANQPFHVRTTITNATLRRQSEIAAYICQRLAPKEIHFEPVYLGGKIGADAGLDSHQAETFVIHFLEARSIAREFDIPLSSSGCRLHLIHGAYCNVFRQVLNLIPGGVATACFKTTTALQTGKWDAIIGKNNSKTGHFEIDERHVRKLCRELDTLPPRCVDCFNRYHCVRECPDFCSLSDDAHPHENATEPSFRCRVQRTLAYAMLRESANRLIAAMRTEQAGGETVNGTTVF